MTIMVLTTLVSGIITGSLYITMALGLAIIYGVTKIFKVLVDAAGAVTYTIDGVAPTVTAAFSFDATDVVVPFIRHLFTTVAPGAINWINLRVGFQ